MNNPLLQASYIDAYGNEWATFQFKVSNQNASSGTHVSVGSLDIVYRYGKQPSERQQTSTES